MVLWYDWRALCDQNVMAIHSVPRGCMGDSEAQRVHSL